MAYDTLTRELLMDQLAHGMSISLHSDYVMRQLNNPVFVRRELGSVIPPFVVDPQGGINQTLLKQYLKRKGMSLAAFEERLEKVLTERFIMDLVNGSLYVPNYELKQEYFAQYAGKKFSIITFSLDEILRKEKNSPLTDQEISDFFEKENSISKRYWVPEKRNAVVWEFDQGNYKVELSDEAVRKLL